MKEPYLEVTLRHLRSMAAYLPREATQRSARSRRVEPGLVIEGTIHRTRAIGRTVNLCFEELAADTVFVDSAGR